MGETLNLTPDAYVRATALLKEELLLGNDALQAVDSLEKILQEHASGEGAQAAAARLEQVLARLSTLERDLARFLAQSGAPRLADFFAAAHVPQQKGIAVLLERASSQQARLKQELLIAAQMLKKGKAFIDFHVNILSATQASDTYAPPKAAAGELRQERPLFDANI